MLAVIAERILVLVSDVWGWHTGTMTCSPEHIPLMFIIQSTAHISSVVIDPYLQCFLQMEIDTIYLFTASGFPHGGSCR
jgi:hypothetical protein